MKIYDNVSVAVKNGDRNFLIYIDGNCDTVQKDVQVALDSGAIEQPDYLDSTDVSLQKREIERRYGKIDAVIINKQNKDKLSIFSGVTVFVEDVPPEKDRRVDDFFERYREMNWKDFSK